MDFSLITYFIPLHDNVFFSTLSEIITLLGEDTIIILVGAFLYWCLSPKQGQRMACTAVSGLFWTLGLKNWLKIPRPWEQWIIAKDQVIRASTATGYSFPSGHTTAGTNIYGYFASVSKKLWVKIVLWVLVGLIGLSRIYLGCHTSYDVLAAIAISVVWIYLAGHLYDRLLPKSDWFIFIYMIPVLFGCTSLFTEQDEDILKMTSFGICVLVGIFIERRFIHFTVTAGWKRRILHYAVGVGVLALLKFWPKHFGIYDILWLKCINYGIIAFWLSCVYPLILSRAALSKNKKRDT
ncbi:MAG: phosphatase PAP2 family protein [Clostridia bacterium]|nr:phosphatase PAP2 family protein [Clostridia bacterium]